MAIKVNARAIKQDTADASVFGYNTVYQSAAPAVAQALSQTANSIASASAKIERRKQENDLFTAQESFGEYQRGLNEAAVQLDTAYASQDEERIKQAEANFNSYDAESEFFTVATYGKEVDDPRVFRKFNEDAKNAWAKQSLATANVKEHRRSMGFVKDDARNAEQSTFNLINGLEGKRMTLSALRNQAAYLNGLYGRGYLNTLPSAAARTAAIGNLNDKVEFLFEAAAQSGAGDSEYVAQVKQMFTDLRADGFFEGFTRSEELMNSADKITAKIAKASAEEQENRLKVAIDKQATIFFNNVRQKVYDPRVLKQGGTEFLEKTASIDSTQLKLGSKERNDLESSRAAAEFFSKPLDENGLTALDIVIRNSFQGAIATRTHPKDNVEIPEQYVALLARTRDFTAISAKVKAIVENIHTQVTTGNPRILETLGISGDANQLMWLRRNGYPYTTLYTKPIGIEFEDALKDPVVMEDYLTRVAYHNQNSATLVMEGANLKRTGDALHGFVLEQMGLSGSLDAAKRVAALTSKFYSMRNADVTQGARFEMIHDFVIDEDGELEQLRLQAMRTGDVAQAEMYEDLQKGIVAHLAVQKTEDLEIPLIGGKALKGFRKLTGKYLKDFRREFNAIEYELLSQNAGIARVSEATGGHQVRVHQSFFNLIDFSEKDPWRILDFALSPLEGSVPYQTIKIAHESAFNDGVYTMIPSMLVPRMVEAYGEEIAENFNLLTDPEMLRTLGEDFASIVDAYEKKDFPKEELGERLIKASIPAGVTGTLEDKPLLDFSAYGKKPDGSNQLGVAVKYYDRVTRSYRQLYDAEARPVVLDIESVKDRIAPTGSLRTPYVNASPLVTPVTVPVSPLF